MTGKELKILRTAKQKTQEEIAKAIGVANTKISEWENEKHKISPAYQKLLKNYFDSL